MEKRVDLHTHSIYSDGSKTPKEVSEEAKSNNVGILALTDHDNIDGSKELIALHDPEIYAYSGVELTAKVAKGRLHILGYNIDLENPELNIESLANIANISKSGMYHRLNKLVEIAASQKVDANEKQ